MAPHERCTFSGRRSQSQLLGLVTP